MNDSTCSARRLSRLGLWAVAFGMLAVPAVVVHAVASMSLFGGEVDSRQLKQTVRLGVVPQPATVGACDGITPWLSVVGGQDRFSPQVANGTVIDATAAVWRSSHAGNYPVMFDASVVGGRSVCWHGGSIIGDYPLETSWDEFHGTTGLRVRTPGFVVDGLSVTNFGDGIGFSAATSNNWSVHRAHLSFIHDDCIENDYMHDGVVSDSFFDGCYVGFSARGHSGQLAPPDGRENSLTIRDSLVRLQPMPTVYKGPSPGHGGFFKWPTNAGNGYGTQLSIHNTIFRADQAPNHGTLGLPTYLDPTTGLETPYLTDCSNNTIVWLGPGDFPATMPSCFRITTDRAVWEAAVDEWMSSH